MDISLTVTTNDGGMTEVYRAQTVYSQVADWSSEGNKLTITFEDCERNVYVNLDKYLQVDIKRVNK